ncbi:hypothetical protein FPV67DRAFT_1476299 [Lyophyllum atratum]|nr:hypothetical protein FPV67DRAFT_1476299 [Lyophyllum atratum]
MTSKATTNGTTPATTTNAQSDQAMRESQGAARFEEELNVFLSGPGMLLQNQEVRDQLKTYIGAPDRVGGGEWTTWVKLGEGYMRIGLRSLLSQRLRGSPVLPIVEGILTFPKVMRAIEEGVSSDLPLAFLPWQMQYSAAWLPRSMICLLLLMKHNYKVPSLAGDVYPLASNYF